jgi:CyaY protein
MNDSEFIALADQTLKQLELALETCGADLDCSMTGNGVLEIEFDDGGKIIVNRHAVAKEMWVAARSGGFHFRWDGSAWRDTRTGGELMAALSDLVSAQSGTKVDLRNS